MKPLYILKIGGSIATYKNRPGISVRKYLLAKIAKAIKRAMRKENFDLILIHGAGAAGHQLAKEYGLKEGTGRDKRKWHGALLSRVVNQKLDSVIMEIFISEKLPVTPTHTASVIIQKDNLLSEVNTSPIKEALRQNCIPLLYGEMVFDKTLGMTICSGDVIAPYLAKKFKAKKMFFASDINGIFTEDPHLHHNAKLIEKINLKKISREIKITGSHNIDVTGGLMGKISSISKLRSPFLQAVEVFNGFCPDNFEKIFLEKKFPHTVITFK